jgi:hypothetical protein
MVVWSFVIGAIVMAVAGLVELWLGIAAEQRPLEELALPLTVADDEEQDEPAQGQRSSSSPLRDDADLGGEV